MVKILVSAISFVNTHKQGSEIYATFAKRLINDVLEKTPFDVLITTNNIKNFDDIVVLNNGRVIVRHEPLENHKTHIGAFNQLLKFYAIKDVNEKYDWVLYLDCDAGFTEQIELNRLESQINYWESLGYDMLALRTNATYDEFEKKYTDSLIDGTNHLFNPKFKFYGIKPEWRGSCFPSEHILFIKNNHKIKLMCEHFESFCTLFETQDIDHPITFDMEAFEIGVSAFLAGYNVGELGWGNQCGIFKVGFNYNNWEQIKI
jgi:hypothetical protein